MQGEYGPVSGFPSADLTGCEGEYHRFHRDAYLMKGKASPVLVFSGTDLYNPAQPLSWYIFKPVSLAGTSFI
ncbi:hypothetical protein BG55_02075 [Erwinia mallotivora]|uniref:Uncharacterized protein n=1 Tax=Erwinia mallotivora TaxID=69222 RepID=A0A014M5Y2_9GAMM|nr:hypothetical protein BG55_02075 [Erwinia mallotivora]